MPMPSQWPFVFIGRLPCSRWLTFQVEREKYFPYVTKSSSNTQIQVSVLFVSFSTCWLSLTMTAHFAGPVSARAGRLPTRTTGSHRITAVVGLVASASALLPTSFFHLTSAVGIFARIFSLAEPQKPAQDERSKPQKQVLLEACCLALNCLFARWLPWLDNSRWPFYYFCLIIFLCWRKWRIFCGWVNSSTSHTKYKCFRDVASFA